MDPIRATGCALVALLLTSSGAFAQVYYRVEIGYSKSVYADIRDKNFGTDGVICGDATCSRSGSLSDVGNSPLLAGGVGWRFTPNVRGDVMLTYRPGYKLDKHDSFNPPATFKADVTSWSLLANEYYEFRLTGWTPYLGAGIGLARNKFGPLTFSDNAGFSGSAESGTKTSLALALMAGAGIPLSGTVILDIGYRFADLGKIETGTGRQSFGFGVASAPYSGATGNLRAHEIVIGLRM